MGGVFASDSVIAAGPPGIAYLVTGGGPEGVQFFVTENGGTSWSAPTTLTSVGGGARIAAAGRKVAIVLNSPEGPAVFENGDAGHGPFARSLVSQGGSVFDVAIEPVNKTLWVASLEMLPNLWRRASGGSTSSRSRSAPAT